MFNITKKASVCRVHLIFTTSSWRNSTNKFGPSPEDSLARIRVEIVQLRIDLEKARLERKNYEEQLAILRKLDDFPVKQVIRDSIVKLEQDRAKVEEETKLLSERLELRAKQAQFMLYAIQQFLVDTEIDKEEEKVRRL